MGGRAVGRTGKLRLLASRKTFSCEKHFKTFIILNIRWKHLKLQTFKPCLRRKHLFKVWEENQNFKFDPGTGCWKTCLKHPLRTFEVVNIQRKKISGSTLAQGAGKPASNIRCEHLKWQTFKERKFQVRPWHRVLENLPQTASARSTSMSPCWYYSGGFRSSFNIQNIFQPFPLLLCLLRQHVTQNI